MRIKFINFTAKLLCGTQMGKPMHRKASILIKLLGLAIAFICNTALSQGQEFKLVSQGKGLSAQKLLEEKIKKSTGQEKLQAINELLDVCMLTTDVKCSTSIFNEYQKLLFDDLNSLLKRISM